MLCGASIVRRRSIAHHPDEKCIMKRSRLTHEQRRSETRERLIDAARTRFLEKGFADTSVENIAETAGYTRGAFYSNFDSKRELLIELLHRDHNRMLADLQAIAADRASDESASRAAACYATSFGDCSYLPLWVEAKLLGLRDAGIRAVLHALWLEQLRLFGNCIRNGSKLADTSLLATVDTTALGLLCLCDGIRIARMYDRESITDEMAESILNASFPPTLSRPPDS
ncbi:TetR/AcrR family transcriptional regulator [Burkholderia multivorans]